MLVRSQLPYNRVSFTWHPLRYFHEVLKVDRVPHLFVLQPLVHLSQTKSFTRNELAIRGYIFSKIADFRWRDNFYRGVVEAKTTLATSGVPFEPLLDPFAELKETAYTDYCHMTPTGNRVVAERVISMMESRYPELFH